MAYDATKCHATKEMTIAALQESFRYWAAKHPTPDEKVISFGGNAKYSPNQLNECIQDKTGHGQVVLDWLATAMKDNKETPTQAITKLMCNKRGLQR